MLRLLLAIDRLEVNNIDREFLQLYNAYCPFLLYDQILIFACSSCFANHRIFALWWDSKIGYTISKSRWQIDTFVAPARERADSINIHINISAALLPLSCCVNVGYREIIFDSSQSTFVCHTLDSGLRTHFLFNYT